MRVDTIDQSEAVDNAHVVVHAENSIEIEVPDASYIQEHPSAFADTNNSTRGMVTSQSDALLNSTLQKFRSQTSSYNSSPEPRKQDQRILKGLSSNSSPVKESPNAIPKASSRIPVPANNAPLKSESQKMASKNMKFTSIATSPIHPDHMFVESDVQHTQMQNNVESEKLKKVIEEMEMTKIDKVWHVILGIFPLLKCLAAIGSD